MKGTLNTFSEALLRHLLTQVRRVSHCIRNNAINSPKSSYNSILKMPISIKFKIRCRIFDLNNYINFSICKSIHTGVYKLALIPASKSGNATNLMMLSRYVSRVTKIHTWSTCKPWDPTVLKETKETRPSV